MIVDKHGYIVNDRVRKAYDRICDGGGVLQSYAQRVQSAEAFLRLILRRPELIERLSQ